MRRRTGTPRAARAGALLGALLLGGYAAAPALAAEPGEVSIDLMEPGESSLRVLVSLPDGVQADLDDVRVTLDGQDAPTTAAVAGNQVRRTAVLAIDTSLSMQEDDRIGAAETAALAFLAAVPDDVFVGVVTFDDDAQTVLEPTQDRAAAEAAVSDLEMNADTALYGGVQAAVTLTGSEGARQVLLLSDGEDSVGGDLAATVQVLQDAGVRLDAVALDEDSPATALGQLAAAGSGEVVAADPESLTAVFSEQAQAIAAQLVLDVEVPAGVDGATAPIAVTIGSAAGPLAASAEAPLGDLGSATTADSAPLVAAPSTETLAIPAWGLYVGVAVCALGLVAVLVLAVPRRPAALTPAERVTTYAETVSARPSRPAQTKGAEDPFATTKAAATNVLKRNQGLEARIAARLEGAGSALKPAEWLLVHLGVFFVVGLLGLLLGGGNVLIELLFLVLGAVGPWFYLGRQRSKRRKAFNAALPDTLQLLSSSLAAGLSLAQGCDTVSREGRDPVAGEFKRVLVETRLGVDLDVALADVAERYESKDFGWVVMAIRIQREVGGNLAELLDTVAATMREREYLRRQVDSLAAEGKLSAWIIGGLPPAFVLYLVLTQRDYVMPMFTDPRGWVMLGLAGVLLGTGVFWMSRLVKVEV
ncbi:type II secretion system F family protein [Nocardioides zeae]|uniref:Tight adherence protein B n=1 Tax=Nocardioides zeae TaxID=1457234 RepID=A0AAJ1U005_9ACTN|nr:type II secretion system F family protein [Nocardioides zeae]MDQ1103215.1 tight adherence protein B [Nocardioides zeae]